MKGFSIIIGLLSGILFGIATPVSKVMLADFNSFQLAGLLYIGAGIAFLPFLLRNRKLEISSLRKSQKKLSVLGIILFGGILGPLLLMLGLQHASAMSVSIWLNMELVATALLGIILFKDHLDSYGWTGVVFTVVAGIIITFQEPASGMISALFITLACICWGLDNHLTAIVDGVSPQTITLIKGFVGGTTNLVIGLFLSGGEMSLASLPLALLIGVFSYGVSIALYVTSAQNLGATRSQILFSTAPFWGILGAYIFLSEPLNFNILIASVFLALGIYFSNKLKHEHAHQHSKLTHIHLHNHLDGHHTHQHIGMTDPGKRHIHMHEHEAMEHTHIHYPDLHHRHKHK